MRSKTSRSALIVLTVIILVVTIFLYNRQALFITRPMEQVEIKGFNLTDSRSSFAATTIGPSYAVDAQTSKILLLFWSLVFGKRANKNHVWEKGSEPGQCSVDCELTDDRSRSKEASAFVVHARDPYPLPSNKSVPWVLFTQENPVHTPVLKNPKYVSQFNLSTSYRLDSDFPTSLFTKPNLVPPVPFQNKTGGVMAAFTNCEPVRTAYLKELMKFISVDSYGGCLKNKQGLNRRYQGDFKTAKTNLERSYKFVIVFFNQDCDYFVDDQILHAFNAGSVPVVMSTEKIDEFLPGNLKNAIINVRHFKSPKLLADRLKFLMDNELEYNKYLKWKVLGLGNIRDTVIGKFWSINPIDVWCHICESVARRRWHREGLQTDLCEARKYESWGLRP